MGIPIGQTYTSTVAGRMLKQCICESCRTEYRYEVEREASGTGTSMLFLDNDGAANRAQDAAYATLESDLEKAVDPVACPACGWFQKKMVHILRKQAAGWTDVPLFIIAIVLLIWGAIKNATALTTISSSLVDYGVIVAVLSIFGAVTAMRKQ